MKDNELKPSPESLIYLALTDELTNLYNRRYLFQQLPQIIKKNQTKNYPFSFCMIDVDHFKEINDTYGHLAGDEVLSKVALLLKENVRDKDIVTRYAGDEFAILFPETSKEEAQPILNKLVQIVADTPCLPQFNLKVTLSAGLASFPDDAQTAKDLIEAADKALYASKKMGRNRVSLFSLIPKEVAPPILPSFKALVGRDEQISQINSLLDLAKQGKWNFTLIKGEHGVGKTRLLTEILKKAEERGFAYLFTSGEEIKMLEPFYLFASLIKNYLIQNKESKTSQKILSLFGKDLLKIIPELKDLAFPIPSQESGESLPEVIIKTFKEISTERTTLLAIDDFQLADELSLELIPLLAQSLLQSPLIVLATYTPFEFKGEKLLEIKEELKEKGLIDEISLENLSKEKTKEIIELNFPQISLEPSFLETFFEITSGNPLFIEQLLNLLVEEKLIYFENGRWLFGSIEPSKLPTTLKDVIKQRLQKLDEEVKETLVQASIIGKGIDLKILKGLGKKSESEVLELVDKIKKIGLVEEEKPLSDERFDFTSQEILKALSEIVEEKEKKLLHNKIGEIIEALYASKIEEAAPFLAYHFTKSDNREKALSYHNQIWQKINQLLPSLPTPEVIPPKKPLSREELEQTSEFLRSFRAALINLKLYPPTSHLIVDSIETALQNLNPLLNERGSLTMSEVEKELLVEGDELDAKGKTYVSAVTSIFIEQGIKSITFKKGLTEEEIISLLKVLSSNPATVKEKGGVEALLKESSITHIKVNEKIYVTLEEKEMIKAGEPKISIQPKEIPPLEIPETIPSPLDFQKILSEVLEGKVAEEEGREALIQLLSPSQSPSFSLFLSEILSQEEKAAEILEKMEKLKSSLDLKDQEKLNKQISQTITSFAPEKIVSLLKKTTGKESFQDIIFSTLPNDKIEKITKLMARSLEETGRKAELPIKKSEIEKIMNKLIDLAQKRGIYQLKEAPETSPFVASQKAEEVLRKSLTPERLKEIPKIVEQLLTEEGKENLTQNIISKLLDELSYPSPNRKDIAQKIEEVSPLLEKKKDILIQMAERLNHIIEEEEENEVLSPLVNILTKQIVQEIKGGEFSKATRSLELLEKKAKAERVKETVNQAMEKIKNETINILINDLKSRNEETQKGASLVLAKLGEKAAPNLIELLSKEDVEIYKIIVKTLYLMREKIIEPALKALTPKTSPRILIALIDILSSISNPQILEAFSRLISHPNPFIRKKIIHVFTKISQPEEAKYILPFIYDKNISVALEAVKALGELKSKESLPSLYELLDSSPEPIQIEICLTLGKIGDESSIPVLLKALFEKKFLLKWSKSEDVRTACAWALSHFKNEEAIKGLKRLTKDKKRKIRLIALEALKSMEKGEALEEPRKGD